MNKNVDNKETNKDWWIFENKKSKEEEAKIKKETKSKKDWWIFD